VIHRHPAQPHDHPLTQPDHDRSPPPSPHPPSRQTPTTPQCTTRIRVNTGRDRCDYDTQTVKLAHAPPPMPAPRRRQCAGCRDDKTARATGQTHYQYSADDRRRPAIGHQLKGYLRKACRSDTSAAS
jgi:hypothetical protein